MVFFFTWDLSLTIRCVSFPWTPLLSGYQPHAFLPNDTNYNVENVAFLDLYGVQHKGIFYRLIQNSIESKYANASFEFFKIANI